ncbi:hypothetical protein BDA96_10G136200 [Sorghum bicolor]|uniref:Uncharacterized protein n=2 Tax=Sorghum bicolor TaxID=4558 RepID=A0A921U0U5_SORBI|nr:uncharacterized protein LOC110430747 [Sorghum bicolor]KAG0513821.1 hypothetical protein BDA96_10G136200 [Sorghum bicolor]KXG19761.1 hypothetical protein SORBI_3010G111700 [Sorghum bicolor]|eukprot:XP_021304324.1 uncharacterized protein LOC110430747 [Sorghum bicolor]
MAAPAAELLASHGCRLRRQRCPPQSDGSYQWRSGLTRIHVGPIGGASHPAPTAPLGGGVAMRCSGSAMAAYACAIEQGRGDHPHPAAGSQKIRKIQRPPRFLLLADHDH